MPLIRQPISVMFTMVLISPPRRNHHSVIDDHVLVSDDVMMGCVLVELKSLRYAAYAVAMLQLALAFLFCQ
jgi:hypothetical protein